MLLSRDTRDRVSRTPSTSQITTYGTVHTPSGLWPYNHRSHCPRTPWIFYRLPSLSPLHSVCLLYGENNENGYIHIFFSSPCTDDLIVAIKGDIEYAKEKFKEPEVENLSKDHPYWAEVSAAAAAADADADADTDRPSGGANPPS